MDELTKLTALRQYERQAEALLTVIRTELTAMQAADMTRRRTRHLRLVK